MKIMNCKECGKEFSYYPPNRKYCSLICAYKNTGKTISIIRKKLFKEGKIQSWNKGINHKKECKICGKEFQYYPSQEKGEKRKYCSLKCFGIATKNIKKWGGKRKVNWLKKHQFKEKHIPHNKGKIKENYKPLEIVHKKMKDVFKNNPKLRENISIRMKNGGAIKARMNKDISPNKPEKELITFFNYWDIPLKFVGNSKEWINGKNKSFNPDFIDKKNKIIVEFDGKYWHKNREELDELRNKTYRNKGYKLLILNEDDLRDKILLMNKIGGLAC